MRQGKHDAGVAITVSSGDVCFMSGWESAHKIHVVVLHFQTEHARDIFWKGRLTFLYPLPIQILPMNRISSAASESLQNLAFQMRLHRSELLRSRAKPSLSCPIMREFSLCLAA